MKKALNGFQCDFCHTVYKGFSEAAKCEDTPMEKPLLEIGDVIIDDQYDSETEIRVYGISFEKHKVNYRMEWQHGFDERWEHMHTIYGNEMLLEYHELLNKV